uniref:Uncharacterized protein n=1 Tax=Panagrolaimus sp. PS1159 TaxID=55785 RepID=A0AC35FRC6_9BILA
MNKILILSLIFVISISCSFAQFYGGYPGMYGGPMMGGYGGYPGMYGGPMMGGYGGYPGMYGGYGMMSPMRMGAMNGAMQGARVGAALGALGGLLG